jgi:hypothetical protein
MRNDIMQGATITTVKKSLLTPPSISTPISHIPHPIPKGIIGETAMHLDISLTNVNVGMPLSVQDKYLVEGRSLYLIKPLDVQVVALRYRYKYCRCYCYCYCHCCDIGIAIAIATVATSVLLLVLLLLLLCDVYVLSYRSSGGYIFGIWDRITAISCLLIQYDLI